MTYAAAAFQGFTIVISSLSLKPSLTWLHLQICTFSYAFLLGATYLLIAQCKGDEYCMKLSTTLKLELATKLAVNESVYILYICS